MGRGSQPVTSPRRSCKVTLWTVLVSLLLLSVMITGSPAPDLRMEGQTSPEPESDSMGTASTGSLDLIPEDSIDLTLRSTWRSHYAENTTADGHSDEDDLLLRSERSPVDPAKNKKNKKSSVRRGVSGCRLRSLPVKVRDLALGYNSNEIVLFKYCSGACQRSRNNYDVTLSTLLKQKVITPGPREQVSSHPCCRPTQYESVSFLDIQNIWRTVEKLSAAECDCVG